MQDDGAPSRVVDETDDTYELDLDSESSDRVDDVLEQALEAVERQERLRSERGEDGGAGADGNAGEGDAAAESRDGANQAGASRGSASQGSASQGSASQGSGAHGAVDEASEAKIAKLKDQLTRTLADFDNFRKRTDREKAELKKVAAGEVLKDILPVIDNLERAVAAGGSVEELKKGLEMVLRQQADVMGRWGVEPVQAVGEAFDPAVHEAVGREESAGVDVPTVSSELQRGYLIHDRLLRPAMVFVTMPAPKAKSEEAASARPAPADTAAGGASDPADGEAVNQSEGQTERD